MYICVYVGYVRMCAGPLEGRGVECPEAGVTGGNKLPNVGAENSLSLEEHTAEPSLKLSFLKQTFNFLR